MRIRITRARPAAEAAADDDAAPGMSVDVPGRMIALLGGSVGVLPALATLATFWLKDKPDADTRRQVSADQAQVQVLQRAMQVETAAGRETSVQLLRALGVLHTGDAARVDALLKADTLPRWAPVEPSGGGASADADVSNVSSRKSGGTNPESAPPSS